MIKKGNRLLMHPNSSNSLEKNKVVLPVYEPIFASYGIS